MPATQPRPEQLTAFADKAPKTGPLVMVNLLKFKDRAAYPDGRETDLTGAQAYGVYAQEVAKLIEAMGGRFLFSAACNAQLIGDGELAWDAVGIVEYPSLEHFQKMTTSAAYQEIHVHREAGLDHQVLINCLAPEQALSVFR